MVSTIGDEVEDDELVQRAMRAYAKRAAYEGWRHDPAVAMLCEVERPGGGRRPRIVVRNVHGVLAIYQHKPSNDRLIWLEA